MRIFVIVIVLITSINSTPAQPPIKVLNFQGDKGFQHDSKEEAMEMVKLLGEKNAWDVISSSDTAIINQDTLPAFDVIVFNNNCGTEGPVFSKDQFRALQAYIRAGGGFVGIHCAGAMWKEEAEFQEWYERLIGTRLVAHPQVQDATLIVENQNHFCTGHLPRKWNIKDEWHVFSSNPRDNVNVLISLDESTYEADTTLKMGDHPFTWYQYFEGGRSFFTSLGHTKAVYQNAHFQKIIESAISWASGRIGYELPTIGNGLILDLDADKEVTTEAQNQVVRWTNQVKNFSAQDFVPHDYGVRLAMPGSGRPLLKENLGELNGHNTIVFTEDELINFQEDAFDYLVKGSGYTWITVIKPYETADPEGETEFGIYRLQDVNSFMGNLRNGGKYEGIWACLDDDLTVWCGSRNGVSFGRFDENNPKLSGPKLEADRYYVVAARMGAGVGEVDIEIFVNEASPFASVKYPTNPWSNPSKLAIGTERDATNHPGSESFDGEIARFLIYERPLSDTELAHAIAYLRDWYNIQ